MFRFLYIFTQLTGWVSHWCRALLCGFLLFASCAPFAIMHVSSLLLIRPFSLYFCNRLDCWQYGTYQKLVLFCLQYLSRAKVVLYGDVEDCFRQQENVLYISNHQAAADFVITNFISAHANCIGDVRFVMKAEILYQVPLYGWYCYNHGGVYVLPKRRGIFPEDLTAKSIQYANHPDVRPVWLVIYPEGSRYSTTSEEEFEREKTLAAAQNRQLLQYHLMPRCRGTHLVLSQLASKFDYVYDVTLIYTVSRNSDGQYVGAPGIFDFICGQPNAELHINVRRIAIAEIPKDHEGLNNWLYERFKEKDERMRAFMSGETQPHLRNLFPNVSDPKYWTLPWSVTIPSFIGYSACLAVLLLTEWGRFVFQWIFICTFVGGYAYVGAISML